MKIKRFLSILILGLLCLMLAFLVFFRSCLCLGQFFFSLLF